MYFPKWVSPLSVPILCGGIALKPVSSAEGEPRTEPETETPANIGVEPRSETETKAQKSAGDAHGARLLRRSSRSSSCPREVRLCEDASSAIRPDSLVGNYAQWQESPRRDILSAWLCMRNATRHMVCREGFAAGAYAWLTSAFHSAVACSALHRLRPSPRTLRSRVGGGRGYPCSDRCCCFG